MGVTRPQLSLSKTVASASHLTSVPLDSILTYTLILSNSGDGDALGSALTDTLPKGLSFGGWLVQPAGSGRDVARNWLTWTGTLSSHRQIRLVYTLTVDQTAAGQTVTNTVRSTADSFVPLVAEVAVRIEGARRLYLPFVSH